MIVLKVFEPKDLKLGLGSYIGQNSTVVAIKQLLNLFLKEERYNVNGIVLLGKYGYGRRILVKAASGEINSPLVMLEHYRHHELLKPDIFSVKKFIRKIKQFSRRYGRCIAFIDDIGNLNNLALSKFIFELDKIRNKEKNNILFIISAESMEELDSSLLRDERFEQIIEITKPKMSGRKRIIEKSLEEVDHDKSINIDAITEYTSGMTTGEIVSVITKKSLLFALTNNRKVINSIDIEKALLKNYFGIENPIEGLDEKQKWQMAVHEAGHAVMQHYLLPDKKINHLSIIAHSGGVLGFSFNVDTIEIYSYPLERIVKEIMVDMAGNIASYIILGTYWSGSSSDFVSVKKRLKKLYAYGFFGPPLKDITNEEIINDLAIKKFWEMTEKETNNIATKMKDKIVKLAEVLLKKESMMSNEIMEILKD